LVVGKEDAPAFAREEARALRDFVLQIARGVAGRVVVEERRRLVGVGEDVPRTRLGVPWKKSPDAYFEGREQALPNTRQRATTFFES
jgi:hypothetical protein